MAAQETIDPEAAEREAHNSPDSWSGGPPAERGGDDGDGDGDPGPWVVVRTFDHPMRAHIARLKVEAEGIDCYLDNEYLIATDWLYSNATGGVKLMVPQRDAARAKAALDLAEPIRPAEEEPAPETCPKCASGQVEQIRLSRRWTFVSLMLLGFPVPFWRRRMRCDACGHEWRSPRRGFEVVYAPKQE